MTKWLNKQHMRRAFNGAATAYDGAADLQREIADHLLTLLKPLPSSKACILDLGAGTGYLSRCLPQHRLISLDVAEHMLYHGKKQSVMKEAVCNDAEYLSIQSNSTDWVVSSMALHWCLDLETALKESHRVLKPKGRLAFALLTEGSLCELKTCWQSIDTHQHVNPFPKETILKKILSPLFSNYTLHTRSWTCYHASLMTLMKKLKAIGAHNVTHNRPQGLTGKQVLQHLEAEYEKYRNQAQQLPLTYHVLFGVCTK